MLKEQLSSEIFPKPKHDGKTKLASVLVIIYGRESKVLMIEKSKKLNIHAGEIAFPGGKWIESDNDLLDTALRETREEIGLNVTRKNVIGQFENVVTLNSGFTISSFISILDDIQQLKINSEVKSVLHIPLIPLLDTLSDDQDPNHKSIQEMYKFLFNDEVIWGASARILKHLANRLSK